MAYLEYYIEGMRQESKLESAETTIGRSPDCTIQLLHDAELSRHHCTVIAREDGSFAVTDHRATNGTFLNEERLSSEALPLQDGDQIRIGKTVMTFRQQAMGTTTQIFGEVADEMNKGAGFHTIMQRILHKDKRDKPDG
jgi:pSer/pThr/pTyr-binding forkhead associated (FHA) protein